MYTHTYIHIYVYIYIYIWHIHGSSTFGAARFLLLMLDLLNAQN